MTSHSKFHVSMNHAGTEEESLDMKAIILDSPPDEHGYYTYRILKGQEFLRIPYSVWAEYVDRDVSLWDARARKTELNSNIEQL